MHPQIISKWIDKEMLLNENISAEILSWLLEEKSITQRIMKDYSFSLELISSKEEIISYEEDRKGMITIRRAIRHYYEDGVDFIDYTHDEPLTRWGVKK